MDNLTATALSSMIHEQFERWNEQKDVMNQLKKDYLKAVPTRTAAKKFIPK